MAGQGNSGHSGHSGADRPSEGSRANDHSEKSEKTGEHLQRAIDKHDTQEHVENRKKELDPKERLSKLTEGRRHFGEHHLTEHQKCANRTEVSLKNGIVDKVQHHNEGETWSRVAKDEFHISQKGAEHEKGAQGFIKADCDVERQGDKIKAVVGHAKYENGREVTYRNGEATEIKHPNGELWQRDQKDKSVWHVTADDTHHPGQKAHFDIKDVKVDKFTGDVKWHVTSGEGKGHDREVDAHGQYHDSLNRVSIIRAESKHLTDAAKHAVEPGKDAAEPAVESAKHATESAQHKTESEPEQRTANDTVPQAKRDSNLIASRIAKDFKVKISLDAHGTAREKSNAKELSNEAYGPDSARWVHQPKLPEQDQIKAPTPLALEADTQSRIGRLTPELPKLTRIEVSDLKLAPMKLNDEQSVQRELNAKRQAELVMPLVYVNQLQRPAGENLKTASSAASDSIHLPQTSPRPIESPIKQQFRPSPMNIEAPIHTFPPLSQESRQNWKRESAPVYHPGPPTMMEIPKSSESGKGPSPVEIPHDKGTKVEAPKPVRATGNEFGRVMASSDDSVPTIKNETKNSPATDHGNPIAAASKEHGLKAMKAQYDHSVDAKPAPNADATPAHNAKNKGDRPFQLGVQETNKGERPFQLGAQETNFKVQASAESLHYASAYDGTAESRKKYSGAIDGQGLSASAQSSDSMRDVHWKPYYDALGKTMQDRLETNLPGVQGIAKVHYEISADGHARATLGQTRGLNDAQRERLKTLLDVHLKPPSHDAIGHGVEWTFSLGKGRFNHVGDKIQRTYVSDGVSTTQFIRGGGNINRNFGNTSKSEPVVLTYQSYQRKG